MTLTTESCVQFALAELQRAEETRQTEEAMREVQRQHELAERARLERERALESELQARRSAALEARLQAELELRELSARERVTAMQHALRELKAERDVLRDNLRSQQHSSSAGVMPPGVRWAMGGLALGMLTLAALLALLVSHQAY